jgi:mRNA interferase RelE/StbE
MRDKVVSNTLEFAPRTEDQLAQIPKNIRKSIFDHIEKLKENPRPENIEPLQGSEKGLYRFRQGDYRIVYSILDQKLLVLTVRVVHRKELYKKKHSK